MTEKISDERITLLISYAEQSEESWVRTEVVDALYELLELRGKQPDTSSGEPNV